MGDSLRLTASERRQALREKRFRGGAFVEENRLISSSSLCPRVIFYTIWDIVHNIQTTQQDTVVVKQL